MPGLGVRDRGVRDRRLGRAVAGCEIELQNPCRYPEARARRWRAWLAPLVAELAPAADTLTVRFVSDREICGLNALYRQRARPTDVLTFPGELRAPGAVDPAPDPWPGSAGERHLGDVVVAVPTARRQAHELGHSVEHELRTLLLHGVLHCLGYDHEADDGAMERLETGLRSRFVDDD